MKPGPNHHRYIGILRAMSPEQRLRKAFELHDLAVELFRHGLRRRHPELSHDEFEMLLRDRLDRCHNRTY
jgi:hypothetical protein